jgi:hypothetical protein
MRLSARTISRDRRRERSLVHELATQPPIPHGPLEQLLDKGSASKCVGRISCAVHAQRDLQPMAYGFVSPIQKV